jgi:hypothetical protein
MVTALVDLNVWMTTPLSENTDKFVKACLLVKNSNNTNKQSEGENDKNNI